MRRSVLIVGPTGPEALESSYANAFGQRGWDVHRWTPATALDRVARGGRLGRQFARFVRVEAWERKANLELLRLADSVQPTLLLVVDTGGVRAGTLAQIRVRCPSTVLYCLYPDSPHNLDAERITALPLFDRVATSSPAWVESFLRLGARTSAFLPFAADPTLHTPAAPRQGDAGDVGFVGTWRPERETFLEAFTDLDLRIWGSRYWRTRTRPGSPLRRCWQGRPLRGDELGSVCAGMRVMLNVMDPATWPGPNMRTFEQAACGAFSLTTRSPALLQLFTEGDNIECFDDVAEARRKVDRYLGDSDGRTRVARSGHAFVSAHHTYAHRVATLTSWLEIDTGVNGRSHAGA